MCPMGKCLLIVVALCLLSGLAGCGQLPETTPTTQSVTAATTQPVSEETVGETTAETLAQTEPTEVTEPVIVQEPVAEPIETGVLITLDGADLAWQLAEAWVRQGRVGKIRYGLGESYHGSQSLARFNTGAGNLQNIACVGLYRSGGKAFQLF